MRYLGAANSNFQHLKHSSESFIRIATLLLQRFQVSSDNTSDVDLSMDISNTTLLQLIQLSGTLLRMKVLDIYFVDINCEALVLLLYLKAQSLN